MKKVMGFALGLIAVGALATAILIFPTIAIIPLAGYTFSALFLMVGAVAGIAARYIARTNGPCKNDLSAYEIPDDGAGSRREFQKAGFACLAKRHKEPKEAAAASETSIYEIVDDSCEDDLSACGMRDDGKNNRRELPQRANLAQRHKEPEAAAASEASIYDKAFQELKTAEEENIIDPVAIAQLRCKCLEAKLRHFQAELKVASYLPILQALEKNHERTKIELEKARQEVAEYAQLLSAATEKNIPWPKFDGDRQRYQQRLETVRLLVNASRPKRAEKPVVHNDEEAKHIAAELERKNAQEERANLMGNKLREIMRAQGN
jgi:hypothetical protein